jgi:Leucine-rich repeat (LRR) protein
MRDISISKSMEENLVFRLEESCSSNAHGTVRHLTISSNWKGDKSEFESAVDLSRIRSLTVFGEWRSFFISDKMRLLRVLDLEGTSGLVDHHLEHIGKLLHLKYLSLRGCDGIFHLPDSLGNMRQLQTLDIKGTCIIVVPKTIIKLRKLQYLRAEARSVLYNNTSDFLCDDLPKLCVACCAPACMRDVTEMEGNPNTSDVCTFYCCVMFPFLARQGKPPGLVVPSGIWKLKALHTLSLVNIARGKAVLKGIRKLTQLRKLGVTGISKKNCHEFCSTLTDLIYLESLSVHLEGEQSLYDCLDGLSSPLKNLQSLKLEGNLAKLPGWTEAPQPCEAKAREDRDIGVRRSHSGSWQATKPGHLTSDEVVIQG